VPELVPRDPVRDRSQDGAQDALPDRALSDPHPGVAVVRRGHAARDRVLDKRQPNDRHGGLPALLRSRDVQHRVRRRLDARRELAIVITGVMLVITFVVFISVNDIKGF